MPEDDDSRAAVDEFLREQIDTVPHLEALLLLWNSRPKPWSIEALAEDLYVAPRVVEGILNDLVRQCLVAADSGFVKAYHYESRQDLDQIVSWVDLTYRRELIRVTRLIHSKPSAAVREFARAFRLKKDNK